MLINYYYMLSMQVDILYKYERTEHYTFMNIYL